MPLGVNWQKNKKLIQAGLDLTESTDRLSILGGSLQDHGFGKTVVVPDPFKWFKIVGKLQIDCPSDSDETGNAVSVRANCCGTTPRLGVEVQPDGCGGWNEVNPDFRKYVIYAATLPDANDIVYCRRGVKDEWLVIGVFGKAVASPSDDSGSEGSGSDDSDSEGSGSEDSGSDEGCSEGNTLTLCSVTCDENDNPVEVCFNVSGRVDENGNIIFRTCPADTGSQDSGPITPPDLPGDPDGGVHIAGVARVNVGGVFVPTGKLGTVGGFADVNTGGFTPGP